MTLLAGVARSKVAARYYTPVAERTIDLWVMHSAESSELPGTAEAIGAWFAKEKPPNQRGSTHHSVDVDSVCDHVEHHDVAWGAAGANHNGIHVEHAGTAYQTEDEWLDAYGREMLDISARLFVVDGHLRHDIPARWLTVEQVAAGWRGVCTHDDVSKAFKRGNHWDPGPGFPKDHWLGLVDGYIAEMNSAPTLPTEPEDTDMLYLRGVRDDGTKTAVYTTNLIERREILPPSTMDRVDPGWRERVVEVPYGHLIRIPDSRL